MESGYMIDMKPHMHDGGINATVFVNGQQICTSKAHYGGTTDGGTVIGGQKWETITGYDICNGPIPVKKGDNLTVEAYYDLQAHRL
jgi:hypothetical protein